MFFKMYQKNLASSMAWVFNILETYLEKKPLMEYYAIKDLVLLPIQNMMDIKEALLQWFINI